MSSFALFSSIQQTLCNGLLRTWDWFVWFTSWCLVANPTNTEGQYV